MRKYTPLVLATALFLPFHATAQGAALTGLGPRVGVSIDPDQFVLGGQLTIGELGNDITFDPNVELGFGDNATVIAINMDGKYHFTVENTNWSPHVGFGLGINFIEVDAPRSAFGVDNSFTEVGVNVIVGAAVPLRAGNRFFSELRIGIGDIPDLKLIAGWNFNM